MAVLNDVSILVAVGVDGGAVAVAVMECGDELAKKLQTTDIRSAFAPVEVPVVAGLYWFAGRSASDFIEGSDGLRETLCDGEFIALTDESSVLPGLRRDPAS